MLDFCLEHDPMITNAVVLFDSYQY